MDNKDLHKQVAVLESQLDMVESELSYLNNLLVQCGFTEGTNSLKATLLEILDETHTL
jgi:hypothetical protein